MRHTQVFVRVVPLDLGLVLSFQQTLGIAKEPTSTKASCFVSVRLFLFAFIQLIPVRLSITGTRWNISDDAPPR